MALTASALQALTQGSDADAWRVIVEQAVEIARKPLAAGNAPSEVVRRDREIGVGNPHGQSILSGYAIDRFHHVPFGGLGAASVDDLVEIHGSSPLERSRSYPLFRYVQEGALRREG